MQVASDTKVSNANSVTTLWLKEPIQFFPRGTATSLNIVILAKCMVSFVLIKCSACHVASGQAYKLFSCPGLATPAACKANNCRI